MSDSALRPGRRCVFFVGLNERIDFLRHTSPWLVSLRTGYNVEKADWFIATRRYRPLRTRTRARGECTGSTVQKIWAGRAGEIPSTGIVSSKGIERKWDSNLTSKTVYYTYVCTRVVRFYKLYTYRRGARSCDVRNSRFAIGGKKDRLFITSPFVLSTRPHIRSPFDRSILKEFVQ